ncbi:hypothetical protein BGX21_006355 [Mortierella sp. AD011]|nr:hypothetical protein BGX20_006469 [Mortierella sp. AD010]KAF9399366.1 hypothetical protein BGX21_006355 [Mortierella sp. AD011]
MVTKHSTASTSHICTASSVLSHLDFQMQPDLALAIMVPMTPFLAFALSVVLFVQAVIASPIAGSGKYRIVSLTEGNPKLGISRGSSSGQPISANGEVDTFTVDKVEGDKFRIAIGDYPFVDNMDRKVFASTSPVQSEIWLLRYSKNQDAYTITTPDEFLGWILHPDSGNAPVSISPIISTRTIPPFFPLFELWRFEPVEQN